MLAVDAGGPAAVRRAVDQQRHRQGRPAERVRATPHQRTLAIELHRRHRVVPVARPALGTPDAVARDTNLPLGALVVRRNVGVADRPVGQRAPGRHAVGAGHLEISRQVAPGLRAIDPGTAAHTGGVVLVGILVWAQCVLVAIPVHHHAWIALEARAGVVPVARVAVVAQVVARDVVEGELAPTLDEQHGLVRLGQHTGRDPAACSGAHDDDVVRAHPVTSKPIMRQDTSSRLPPLPGSP